MARSMKSTIMLAGIFMLSMVGSAWAQRTAPDPFRGLKKALEQAGAAALTTTQEEQLKTLIQTYRDNQSHEPSEEVQAAREAYDAAILAGNQVAANTQAVVLANLRAAAIASHLQAEAKFKLDVIAILQTNGDQAGALRTKFGDEGFLRILGGLTRSGRGPGGGGPAEEVANVLVADVLAADGIVDKKWL